MIIENLSDGCSIVWEEKSGADAYIDNAPAYFVTDDKGNIDGVFWGKWCWYSIVFLRLIDGEWVEDTNMEECYYPGFRNDPIDPDINSLTWMEEGMRAQVHRRRTASCGLDDYGDFAFDTWYNGESVVLGGEDVIMKNGKLIPFEDVTEC